MAPHRETIRDRATEILTRFDELIAVGMAWSQALGIEDEHSDLDLQAFATRVPALDRRREVYRRAEVQIGPLDHSVAEEFEAPPCRVHFVVDWLTVDGLKCDFLWLPCDEVDRLLAALLWQPDQREAVAVLAGTVKPVLDPQGYLAKMKQECPEYPDARAKSKAGSKLHYAHFFLCGWAVLHKCLFRHDIVAYNQAESEMVGVLIDALYAANRTWQHDRRRLRFHAKQFRVLPRDFLDRLESVILKRGAHTDLQTCHRELLSLYRDLAVAANEAHAGWQLPTDWTVGDGENAATASMCGGS